MSSRDRVDLLGGDMSQGGYEEILSDEEDSLDSLLDEGVRDKWLILKGVVDE